MGGDGTATSQKRSIIQKELKWSCAAVRQCGFSGNHRSNTNCYRCGRDKRGVPDPNFIPKQRS
eukprot:8494133-Pyramimonas_sp.AAC.1